MAWLPKIREGGIISGHDYCNQYPGLIQAVEDTFEKWTVWRGTHWKGAPPEQVERYWPVWCVQL